MTWSRGRLGPAVRKPVPVRALHDALPRLAHPEDFVLALLPYVVLAVLVAWLAVLQPKSLTFDQFAQITNIELVLILLGVGQTIVVLTGGIDLSVGGVLSVVNAIAASHMAAKADAIWVSIVLIALGWLPGVANGLLIVYGELQPFIVTLATWFIWGGIAFLFLPVTGGTVNASLGWLSTGTVTGVQNPIWALVIVVLFGGWFLRTRLGLEIRSVGSDRESAFQSGLRAKRAVVAAYGLSSWWTTLGGIVLSAQTLSGDPTVGDSYILPSVAAVVIGGTSLFGGSGTITGTAVGALVLAYVYSVTFALNLSSQWGVIASGLLLIFTVSLQLMVRIAFRRRGEL
jgi:ribose transport system permease protein